MVHWGLEDQFQPGPGNPEQIRTRFKVEKPYFLFVGYLFKRRNILTLIRAFKKLVDRFPDYQLVLLGRDSELGAELKQLKRDLGLETRVVQIDYVSEEELLWFYQGAFALVHPSEYEGFGLPAVEAMACGVPVLIGKAEGMVEATGNAARVISPLNADSLAQAMIDLVGDEGERRRWIDEGKRRSGELRWAKTAEAILDSLERAVF